MKEKPMLGLATTRELLNEITARLDVDGLLEYRTVDDCPASECDKPKELSPYGDAKEWREKYFILKGIHEYYKERMVSLDDVLKVFDDAHIGKSILMTDDGLCFIQHIKGIRSAIEQMKRSEL